MFSDRKTIPKWKKGPKGFADKANQQLDAIDQRLPGVPVGQANLGKQAITPAEPFVTFGILLDQTGGSNGDDTTQCSYTYTVKDMADNVLATSVNPATGDHYAQRPTVGFRIAATAGVATYVDGTLTILLTNEIDDLEACS